MKQNSQIIKEQFKGYPLTFRKKIEATTRILPPDELLKLCISIKKDIKEKKEAETPTLLESIILNSVGFERNESLKDGCYMDYHNKLIQKHGKGFILGQYQLFRNENEGLLLHDTDNINDIIVRLESVISLIASQVMSNTLNLEDYLKANAINKKAVDGIINKVLKG